LNNGMKLGRLVPWIAGVAALGALWVWADRLLPGGDAGELRVVAPEECDLNERACAAELSSAERRCWSWRHGRCRPCSRWR